MADFPKDIESVQLYIKRRVSKHIFRHEFFGLKRMTTFLRLTLLFRIFYDSFASSIIDPNFD